MFMDLAEIVKFPGHRGDLPQKNGASTSGGSTRMREKEFHSSKSMLPPRRSTVSFTKTGCRPCSVLLLKVASPTRTTRRKTLERQKDRRIDGPAPAEVPNSMAVTAPRHAVHRTADGPSVRLSSASTIRHPQAAPSRSNPYV